MGRILLLDSIVSMNVTSRCILLLLVQNNNVGIVMKCFLKYNIKKKQFNLTTLRLFRSKVDQAPETTKSILIEFNNIPGGTQKWDKSFAIFLSKLWEGASRNRCTGGSTLNLGAFLCFLKRAEEKSKISHIQNEPRRGEREHFFF